MMDMAEESESETVEVPLSTIGNASLGDKITMEVADIKGDQAVLRLASSEDVEEPAEPKEDVLGKMGEQFNNLDQSNV